MDKRVTPHVLAHEFGHVLNVPGDYPGVAEFCNDLMGYGGPFGNRIHKYQADLARKK